MHSIPAEQTASARLRSAIRGERNRAKSKTFIADFTRFDDQPLFEQRQLSITFQANEID